MSEQFLTILFMEKERQSLHMQKAFGIVVLKGTAKPERQTSLNSADNKL